MAPGGREPEGRLLGGVWEGSNNLCREGPGEGPLGPSHFDPDPELGCEKFFKGVEKTTLRPHF